jgi:hypothetical protein
MFAYGRNMYSLSRAGYYPKVLSLTGKNQTPWVALIAGAIIGFVALVVIDSTGGSGSPAGAIVLNIAVWGAMLAYIMQMVSFVILRRKFPNMNRPYKSPWGMNGAVIAARSENDTGNNPHNPMYGIYRAGADGSLATLIALVIVRVMQERKKLDKAVQSVPPTVCPVPEQPKRPSQGTVIATARQIWELEHQLEDLRGRLARTDRERAELASDAVALGASLAESERRNEALSAELAELRKSVDSGYTRLPLPPSRTQLRPVDATEIDDRPTPREGTRLRR